MEFFSEKYEPEVEKRYRVYKVGGVWPYRVWGVYPLNIMGLPPFNRVTYIATIKVNNKKVYIMKIKVLKKPVKMTD